MDELRLKALVQAEEALGENLQWIADRLDLAIRQKDPETLRKMAQLNAAWISVVKALNASL